MGVERYRIAKQQVFDVIPTRFFTLVEEECALNTVLKYEGVVAIKDGEGLLVNELAGAE